jgi:hypothetical protein
VIIDFPHAWLKRTLLSEVISKFTNINGNWHKISLYPFL